MNVSGCYSLVNDYMSREITVTDSPISERVARITPSPQQQLHFQPGDVLGFYVESHGQGDFAGGDDDNGVVLLNNDIGYSSESVRFASFGTPAQTSQSGSCPYPIGTSRVLNRLTHAAPVISISVISQLCSQNPSVITHSSNNGLLAGISVIVIVVCIAIVTFVITMVIVIVRKRAPSTQQSRNFSMALSNQVYGKTEHRQLVLW